VVWQTIVDLCGGRAVALPLQRSGAFDRRHLNVSAMGRRRSRQVSSVSCLVY
jgi:hypothetical protein